MKTRGLLFSLLSLLAAGAIAGCSGGNHAVLPARQNSGNTPSMSTPKSVSPALIKPAPMAKTAVLPAGAMHSPPKTQVAPMGSSWTQLPGSASQVSAAADGSIWVLSTDPAGSTDKYIWHYANGQWTNIPGAASQIAAAPNGSLYAVNTGGGTYLYKNGSWTALGGGAIGLTAAQDGSVYVLSNAGSQADKAIWHNAAGVWTQMPGSGSHLAASMDTRSYTVPGGNVNPGGYYVINSTGGIYYGNTNGVYASFPGAASSIAPTAYGGLFVLAYPISTGGESIWYYNLDTPGWTALPGAAVSLSESGGHLYAVAANGAIYMTNAQPAAGTALTYNNASGYAAWTPYDIATNYQFPVQSGYDGMGETVAIVIESMPLSSDMSTYLNYLGITRRGSFTTESVDGGNATDSAGESTLDSQTIAGLAPGANVIVYVMPDLNEQSTVDAYNQVLSDGKANVVSMSYGGCEYQGIDTIEGPLFAQMAAQGIAAVASSGDTGNECYNGSYILGASSPASNPNVIGVGGTEVPDPGSVLGTTLWNDCAGANNGDNCMGSGGVSGNAPNSFAGYPIPSWQKGLAGEASTTLKNVPDIAMPADNDLGYEASYGWISNGGTSWSAPQTAALLSEIYEYCGVTAIANPARIFYTAFAQDGYNDFLDVTSGDDSYFSATPSNAAATGFDNVSGIGAPYGMAIAQRICPNNRPTLVRTASHVTVALDSAAPATARVLQNVVRARNAFDNGERAAAAPTRVTFVLRATPALAQNEQTVVSDLQNAGFTIVRRFSNHLVVDAQAPSSVVERYFNTRIHDFTQAQYGERFANTQPDVVPASIAPYVSGVLTQNLVLQHIRPHVRLLTPHQTLPRVLRQ